MSKPKSVSRQRKEATHEFFPRSKVSSSKDAFTFNKAPINKQVSYQETRKKVIADQEDVMEEKKHGRKATTFINKLYQDDDEYDELKVHGMIDEDDQEVNEARNQKAELMTRRKTKTLDKMGSKKTSKIVDMGSKIGKLNLKKDSLAMFAICEVNKDYLIVNHTRNSKGYIPLTASDMKENNFKRGQLVVAMVNGEIRGATTGDIYNFKSGKSGLNKKVQLTLDMRYLNKLLSVKKVTKNMVLSAKVESKEAKGYMIDFGFKDKTKGFLKTSEQTEAASLVGKRVYVVVKTVIAESKVIKCELLSKDNKTEVVQQASTESNLEDDFKLTAAHLKPGFLVSSKVSKLYENGFQLTFLGGLEGSVFQDHHDTKIKDIKIGSKMNARIISVDALTKSITLSTLPHIVEWSPDSKNSTELPKVGQSFENVKIKRNLYGDSYQVDLGNGMDAFLHKLHAKKEEDEPQTEEDEDMPVNKFIPAQKKYQAGDKLPSVKVKEINYFDLVPLLSFKDTVVNEANLNYHMIQAGDYLEATIEKVNEEMKYVTLRLNQFVKGNLHLESMADNPLKTMPPKLCELGKKIKVRVLNVNVGKRFIEFTKKDSFMKDDAPVYQSYKEVKKGNKVVCNVVSHCEHGLVVKSFGNIKGLITFEDLKHKEKVSTIDEKQYKTGTVLKAYVLFKKADKGLALTLSKKKAKADDDEDEPGHHQTIESSFMPNDLELEQILANPKFGTMIKPSKDSSLVGQVFNFRLLESPEDETRGFYLVKSLDASKKSKNFIGLLPKCLVSSFGLFLNQNMNSSLRFSGLVLETYRDSLPMVSIQPDLIASVSDIPCNPKEEELILTGGQTFIGICNGLQGKAGRVSVRFFNGVQKVIKVKDLNTTTNYDKIYTPGKVLRVAVNKLDRLCTKQQVLKATVTKDGQLNDLKTQISAFGQQYVVNMQAAKSNDNDETPFNVQIGKTVQVEVQLVKDYGIIGQIIDAEGSEVQTGFILNDHKIQNKYKAGQKLTCRILDVDTVKKIADLKELLKGTEEQNAGKNKIKPESKQKVIVELNKEGYLVVTFKNSKSTLGICLAINFNQDSESQDIQIGEELDVQVNKWNEEGQFFELYQVPKEAKKKSTNGASVGTLSELKQGVKLTGQIKSIKAQSIYVQLPKSEANPKHVQIGRLHMIECQSFQEFKSFAIGDKIECNILHIQKDKSSDRTWMELTRKAKHLAKHQGLCEEEMQNTPLSLEDLKEGQSYNAMIVSNSLQSEEAINVKFSQPVQLQISPFIRGVVAFNHVQDIQSLAQAGLLKQKFKVGDSVSTVYLGNSNWSLLEKPLDVKTKNFKKGNLVAARFVKYIPGKGVSVQLSMSKSDHHFGFIPICELTDQINGNAVSEQADKSIFAARIIDFEAKTGKPILSTRESVVKAETWKNIGPESTSLAFKQEDGQNQYDGNMRNKILKYGANLALERGDLAVGYVTNIGKAGCFVQIGHNCTVRAGLNELNDSPNFDFATEMPLGRLVLGRISKVDSGDNKRFHFSTRQSITVYGVGVIDRSKLAVDDEAEVIIMAIAEGKAFAQIKGTYIKIKVKQITADLKIGDHVTVSLKKVTKEKISSIFLKKLPASECLSEEQKRIQKLYNGVEKEARSSLPKLKAFLQESQGKSANASKKVDFDPALIDQKNFMGRDEQIAQQIADLEALDEQDNEEDDEKMEVDSKDSDADEMKRLMNIKYESDEEMAEEGEQEQDEDEEGEDESEAESIHGGESMEEEMDEPSSSDDEESNQKLVGKKRTLKDRRKEEMAIRAKEKQMRSGEYEPKDIDDFERLLVANQDQSYLWIQYIAFMLDNLGVDAARKVAERAVKSICISNEEDKLNIWTAYMNLESNFGNQETLEQCTKRALEVNDRKRVYNNLIDIYKQSQNFEYIEPIYKQLVKKYSNSVDLWGSYLEFIFDMRTKQKEKHVVAASLEFSEPKAVLTKSMQALSKDQHVNMISKFGLLEFKSGNPESGRTMFEGIVSNYPKRMDIWAIYMDMEAKYGQGNNTQARHLFERCLSSEHIQKKPKKMKLVFQKYMEYEKNQGNKNNLIDLRKRVEDYLSKAFGQAEQQGSDSN